MPPFFAASWFWRGTQSAIFYYLSCSPCVDRRYKRKRKQEALREEKQRPKIELSQPGMIAQPLPFHTNHAWAEEIIAGPGPPKEYRRDSLGGKLKQETSRKRDRQTNNKEVDANIPNSKEGAKSQISNDDSYHTTNTERSRNSPSGMNEPTRPPVDRKPSTIDALKDTFRSTLHPDKWNWKRYEREDEVLSGTNDKPTMWDRATGQGIKRRKSSHGRARATTNESDRYDYTRAVNPEVNDLHPPVVSQLPARREEVAWMMLPPPSAAVMEGKRRPGVDSGWRQPLARIGRTKQEAEEMRHARTELQAHPPPLVATPGQMSEESFDESPETDDENSEDFEEDPLPDRASSLPTDTLRSSPPMRKPHIEKSNVQRPPLATVPNAHTSNSKFSADWDYFLKLELPQIPARSRRSLPI